MDKQKDLTSKLHDKRYKGIILDFDDTLYHLEIDWNLLRETLEEELKYSFRKVGNTMYNLRIQGSPLYQKAFSIIQKFELDGFLNGYANKDLIAHLRQVKNKKLAIYSMNARPAIDKFLERYGLSTKIHPIITQETVHSPKPHDKDILNTISLSKLDKTEVLYVGNSGDDKTSGELAGITTILIAI